MANIPSLLVNAVTTFDGKALAKGEKQIGGLEKSTKKLAKAFLAAFSVQKIVQFGKAASKAFIEDEKAATRLAQSVQNLGLAFETPRIEEFIRQLSAASGVTDDQLRPSMQKLLQTTGSLTKSTALLTQALDISRGSGVDYETVVNDLTMAYTGQTRGLNKYKLGLSQAELKTMSFTDIQEKLADTFTGANAAYLETYAGKLGILSNAAGEAQETIGKGLVDSLSLLAGDGNSIQPLADSMQDFAVYVSDAIYGVAVLVDKIKNIPGVEFVSKNQKSILGALGTTGTIFSAIEALQKLGIGAKSEAGMGGYPSSALGPGYVDPNDAARKKSEAEAAKREKERLARERAAAAAAAKKVAADKQKLALSKATAVFDSNRITLAAALQATYDKETKLRLEALMLIEEDKGELALKKIGELAAFQKNADMQKLAGVEEISNATLGALNTQLLTELRVINDSKMAEGNKELAREEAFKKYNAAITAAGTLMNREAYNERVQIQLTEIQRLASISKTGNAAITATRLAESAELSMIDRVAIAQKAADDQRLKALADYTSALNKVGISGGSNLAPSPQTIKDLGPLGGLAAGVIAGVNPGVLTPPPSLTTPSPNYGWNPTMGFPGGSSVDITVNAGIGDPEAIARAVEDILNQSGYRGTSVNRNTGVYAV
jgi:hypothetical protein